MLTLQDVHARIERIRHAADVEADDERAHGLEDALRAEVLAAVSEGHPQTAELAALALSTDAINFHRRCG